MLGPVYHALHNDLTGLHVKWQEYRTLFAHSPDRVELLNQTAGMFFRVIQDVMWHDVLLHIARLTDPPRSVGRNNLTLFALSPNITDASLADKVEQLANVAKTTSVFARDWRNRRLAHHDLAVALNGAPTPLAATSRHDVELALRDLRAVLKAVHAHYLTAEIRFEDVVTIRNAEALVSTLARAAEHRTARSRSRAE